MLNSTIFLLLSILFIFLGIIVIIYAFYIKSGAEKRVSTEPAIPKRSFADSSAKTEQADNFFDEPEPVKDISDSITIIDEDQNVSEDPDEGNGSDEPVPEEPLPVDPSQVISKSSVVLFIDESNAIDYSKKTLVIDKKNIDYTKLKRAGKGTCILEKDGLILVIDKKIFRYDFCSAADVKCGDNYCAVKLKGSNSVKLCIIENNRAFLDEVESCFTENRYTY